MKTILSIDGGGMKGGIPCAMLAELERQAGKPCHKLFDLMYGTSVGGILALLLSIGVPAADAMKFFTVDGPAIFKRHWWRRHGLFMPRYPAKVIERRLQDRFQGKTLADCLTKVGITAFDLAARDAHFFRSFDQENYALWEVARATSAAQTFFPAFKLDNMILWDGGNEANNPAMCALADGTKLWGDVPMRVLSLGCGDSPAHYDARKLVSCGMARNGTASLEVLFSAGSDVVDHQMEQMIGAEYVRIQPTFATPTDMDDATPAGLATLKRNAEECITRHGHLLEQFYQAAKSA
jgi:patatin-like phospholipase/acyl hydrolase